MKKLFLLAALGVAGIMSANTKEELTSSCEPETIVSECIGYAIVTTCSDETYYDTVCWGEGTENPTFNDAMKCSRRIAALVNEMMC